MQRKEIEINIDTNDAEKNLENTGESLEALTESSERLNKELKETSKAGKQAGDDLEDAGKSAKKGGNLFKRAGKAISSVGKTIATGLGIGIGIKLFEKLTEILSANQAVVDTVNTVFTSLSIAVNDVVKAVSKAVKTVSEANGGFDATTTVLKNLITIGLAPLKTLFYGVQGAVYNLQLAWEESFLGDKDQDTITRLQEKIKGVEENLTNVVGGAIEAGKSVYKNIGEAVNEVVTGTKEVVTAGGKAIKDINVSAITEQAKAMEQSKKALDFLEIQQRILFEQYDRTAEKLRQIRDNDQISIKERIAANERLSEVLNEQAEAEKKSVKERIAILQTQQSELGATHEREVEIAELRAELAAVDADIEGKRSEQLMNRNSLIRESIELQKLEGQGKQEVQTIEDEIILAGIANEEQKLQAEIEIAERRNALREQQLQKEIERYQRGTAARIEAENQYKVFKAESEKELTDLESKLAEQRIKNEKAVQDAKLEGMVSTLSSISNLLSIFSEENKALAKAAVIIDAAVAAIGIWKSSTSLPEPIASINRAIQTAALGIATIRSINKINSAKKGSTGGGASIGGGSATPRGTTGIPSSVPMGSTPDASSAVNNQNNQLLQSINNNLLKPQRNYVVSTDVSNQQELDRKIQNKASLGN